MRSESATDLVVIGGGLAGLAAAALAARQGRRVRLFEKAGELGGRASTQLKEGFAFNVGPHALYRGGAAMRVLAQLGVTPQGAPGSRRSMRHRGSRPPSTSGSRR